jgi:hypothetical protein
MIKVIVLFMIKVIVLLRIKVIVILTIKMPVCFMVKVFTFMTKVINFEFQFFIIFRIKLAILTFA